MYFGVMMILCGGWILVQQAALCYYALLIFTAFNIFIITLGEPGLNNGFGEESINYRKRIERWFYL